jgi:hypothetical protein
VLALAVERKAQLLAHHLGTLQRRRHALVEVDHGAVRLHRPQRQEQVDDDADLDLKKIGERGIGGHGLDRLGTILARDFETLLVLLRVGRALAKQVGLGVIDLDARHVLDELEHRAVVVRIVAGGAQDFGDGRRVGLRIDRLAPLVGLVGNAAQHRDVERQHRALRKQHHGRARAHGVPDAELVIDIGIGAGDVGDRIGAHHQPLEHRLVDRPADPLLVGAHRIEPRHLDRRRDDLPINRIEVGRPPEYVGFDVERHQHEAQGILWTFAVGHSLRLLQSFRL